ncbi:unnamed protein product [Owenia fusiformis]|uniref:Uncharacterized protein n=1 Tax=Owenia fusiformis TaxID=6347 RepID=A0A8S4N2T8_OWEFU|nr:unnamed protein product [Owenia fusiformis]
MSYEMLHTYYLKGVGCSHAAPSTQIQDEQTVIGDRVQEPSPLEHTNKEYSERSTKDVVGGAITAGCIKARSVCKSPKIKMGTRPLRQSPTDVDFFDIDTKICNTMRRQRLNSMTKIKHGISALMPLANVRSAESTSNDIVDISNTASVTERTPYRTVESKREVRNRLNTNK